MLKILEGLEGAFEKDGIIPVDLNNQLINSLVGHEMITACRLVLSLIPFKKIDNKEFREYGEQAIKTMDYWMENVEIPLGDIFLAFKNIFFEKEANDAINDVMDFLEYLLKNPNNANKKKEAMNALTYYKRTVENNKTAIERVNVNIDSFRKKIYDDAKNFQIINEGLPNIIKANNDKIINYKIKIETMTQKITELTETLRKILVEGGIYIGNKPGIIGTISEENFSYADEVFFRATLLATLCKQNFFSGSEARRLEEGLINFIKIKKELYKLNEQAPILFSMSAQISNLYALCLNFATTAQAIKRSWDKIYFNLDRLDNVLRNMQNMENLTDYAKRNLKKNFCNRQKKIKEIIEKYNRSMMLGIPIDKTAQKIIKLSSCMSSKYYYSEPQNGLLYISAKELHGIITMIRNEY